MRKTMCIICLLLLSMTAIASARECDKPVVRVTWYEYVMDKGFSGGYVDILSKKYANTCKCYERIGNLPDVYGIVSERWDGEFCMVGGNINRVKAVVVESTPAAVVEPEPDCTPVRTCTYDDVVKNAFQECSRYDRWHRCVEHRWACQEDYDLFCDKYVGCGHNRHCVDWDCKKTLEHCHETNPCSQA